MSGFVVLTPAQATDLRYLVALYRLTVSFTRQRPVVGDSVRTGRALAHRGLVRPAAQQFSDRRCCWVPTPEGIRYVETNFVPFCQFAEAAVQRAVERMRMA